MSKRSLVSILLYVTAGLLCTGFFKTASGLNEKGNKAYKEKHYSTAIEAYQKAQVRSPETPEIRYNLGTTLYQVDQYQEAFQELERSLANAKTDDLKAKAWYNFGNANYRLGQFDPAIEAYRNTLELNPDDQDAKFNLELLQKKKSVFEMKQEKRDKERKEKPPQSQQKKDQSQSGGQSKKDQESQGQGKADENQQQSQGEQQGSRKDQKENEESDASAGMEDKDKSEENKEKPLGQAEKDKGEEREQGTAQKEEDQPKDGEKQQGVPAQPLYQGQMSRQDALRILNALKDSEQELQVLRRPQIHKRAEEQEPLKDW